jgi:hypothetical protein
MKKLLLSGLLVLVLFTSAFSAELVAPFTKVKEMVKEKGVSVETDVKVITFKTEIDGKPVRVDFIVAENNVGIEMTDGRNSIIVGYDTTNKVYFMVINPDETSLPVVITDTNAQLFGFNVFRLLVDKNLL